MTRGGALASARVLRALAAVIAGNAIYFLVAFPRLSESARHRPFALDLGLALDFALCVALYLALGVVLRLAARR